MQILENHLLTVTKQVRFPRSKKRRIQKKWRKRPGNIKTVPDRQCIMIGDKIICHPVVAAELRAAIKVHGRKEKQYAPSFGNGLFAGSWM